MTKITVFSPATVANLSCGYDVLGMCLSHIGDEITIKKVSKKGIFITKMQGYNLSEKVSENAAGVAALALYKKLDVSFGFELEIIKKVMPGSGIGSSASSSAGAVVGINRILGNPFTNLELIEFAMEGERIACGSPIADNVSPAILGGFTLVKSTQPLHVLSLPTPKNLFVVILHPQIEIKTSESRKILPVNIPLSDAVIQWANVGSFVSALYENDYQLLSDSLKDVIIEPHRKKLIPFFDEVKKIAISNGSLACGISGSGPSIFSICKSKKIANLITKKLNHFYKSTNIDFNIINTQLNENGVLIKELKD